MTKTKVAVAGVMTAALLLGVGLGAHAQNRAQNPGQIAGQPAPAAVKARMDERRTARTTALHDILAITPAQEGAWSAYQAATRPVRPDRQRGPSARAERQDLTTPERLDHMVEQANARHDEMLSRAAATRQFYGQLSPAQKKAFDALPQVRPGEGRRGGPGAGPGGHGMDGRMGPGPRGGPGGFGQGRGPRPQAPAN
jgi:hypothetical protein